MSSELDTRVPNSARVWNYWLGGKDHFRADREAGDAVVELYPSVLTQAAEDRKFLGRAVKYLADEGITQFLDIGSGLPAADNTHEVAQRFVPEAKIVYVDNDPMVLSHARALLRSTPEGAVDYIDADLRSPHKILGVAARTLDFSKPVALMLLGVLHHLAPEDDPHAVVRTLTAFLAPGSALVINHATNDVCHSGITAAAEYWNDVLGGRPKVTLRSPEEIERFFSGLTLVKPGVVSCSRWRPPVRGVIDGDEFSEVIEVDEFCGVALVPGSIPTRLPSFVGAVSR